jgi:CheY-like chemotaxis protein
MSVAHDVIMVVDDEAEMLSLIDLTLRRHGLTVLKVPSAALALHLTKSMKPSLFILDILMPGMDGIELCRQLRVNPHTAEIPIIMVSILDTPKSRRQASDNGANAFIPKKHLTNELVTMIFDFLDPNDKRQARLIH